MNTSTKWIILTTSILIMSLGGVGFAEEDSAIPDATVEMEQQANLSGPEQTAWADRELANMRQLSRRIQRMLDQARQEQDIIKIGCLNNKLTELNATIRSFESVAERHAEAVRSRNEERRNHHFHLMAILAERTRSMRVEAEGCIGGTDVVFGRTNVEVDIDTSITQDDTTAYPVDDFVWDRPASASGSY